MVESRSSRGLDRSDARTPAGNTEDGREKNEGADEEVRG